MGNSGKDPSGIFYIDHLSLEIILLLSLYNLTFHVEHLKIRTNLAISNKYNCFWLFFLQPPQKFAGGGGEGKRALFFPYLHT